MAGVRELSLARLDRASVVLVGPAGVVADACDDTGQVHRLRVEEGLAAIECLERGQLVDVLLDEIRELAEQATALVAGYLEAPRGLERRLGCLDGSVDVLSRRGGDLSDDLASYGVEDTARVVSIYAMDARKRATYSMVAPSEESTN